MDPKVPPQLVSLLSACSYSIPDGKSHPGGLFGHEHPKLYMEH